MRTLGLLMLSLGMWGCTGDIAAPPPGPAPWEPPGPPPPPPPPVDVCADGPQAGRVPLARLNRSSYDNSVRDLLGDTTRPAQREFPPDESHDGFDNLGVVQTVSALHVEQWLSAAEQLASEVVRREFDRGERLELRLAANSGLETQGAFELPGHPGGMDIVVYGQAHQLFEIERAGEFVFTASAVGRDPRTSGEDGGYATLNLRLKLDNQPTVDVLIYTPDAGPLAVSARVQLEAGFHRLAVEHHQEQFPYGLSDGGTNPVWHRRLHLWDAQLERPSAAIPTEEWRVRRCDVTTAGCVRTTLSALMRRAFRRPVAPDELDALMSSVVSPSLAQGDKPERALMLGVAAVLLSPHFLYRPEVDDGAPSGAVRPLTGPELATRLSYFVWSSVPDEELLTAAEEGHLADPAKVATQFRRMLADPKARALIDDFVGQWLSTRGFPGMEKDARRFPEFDAALRASMRAETEGTFLDALQRNAPLSTLVSSDFALIDGRLAAHYGLPPPPSPGLMRVQVPPQQRGGLLTQAGPLAFASPPTRTSPVFRGKWVLNSFLCTPPPPPPPNVEGLVQPPNPTGTLRQQLEAHRSNPACAGCHAVIDPIGFAFENYDAIGRWRTHDVGGFPIDSSGTLVDGRSFSSGQQLRNLLAADPAVHRCITRNVFTYGLARQISASDACAVKLAAGEDRGLADVLEQLVLSVPFNSRQTEEVRP